MRSEKVPLHRRVPLLGQARRFARRHLFAFLQRVLRTEDGQFMVADTLRGLLDPAPDLENELRDNPYRELKSARPVMPEASQTAAVFITARFRTGSTLLWNLFRHVQGITAYYEPIHDARWFELPPEVERVDPTHRHVSNYSEEYRGLEILSQYYRNEWSSRNLYMGPSFWEPKLRQYIEILIERAAGRPVLQFNNVDFRLQWLRQHFPTAQIVHLYRHPRDQWLSSLYGSTVPPDASIRDFVRHDHFDLLQWGRDLRLRFPFLHEREIEHPYMLFYYIWKLSFAFGRRFSHYSISFEEMLDSPREHLKRLFDFLQIEDVDWPTLLELIEENASGKWREYAEDSWFRQQESACDKVLEQFFNGMRPDLSLGDQLLTPKHISKAKPIGILD